MDLKVSYMFCNSKNTFELESILECLLPFCKIYYDVLNFYNYFLNLKPCWASLQSFWGP